MPIDGHFGGSLAESPQRLMQHRRDRVCEIELTVTMFAIGKSLGRARGEISVVPDSFLVDLRRAFHFRHYQTSPVTPLRVTFHLR